MHASWTYSKGSTVLADFSFPSTSYVVSTKILSDMIRVGNPSSRSHATQRPIRDGQEWPEWDATDKSYGAPPTTVNGTTTPLTKRDHRLLNALTRAPDRFASSLRRLPADLHLAHNALMPAKHLGLVVGNYYSSRVVVALVVWTRDTRDRSKLA